VDTVLSILMLAALAMLAGAFWLWRRQGAIRQVWLMIVVALIMLLNVAIWTIPDKGGTAPVDRAAGPPR
jgi:drug/metabolite transporter superfamily protein YnfA